jgi:tetratricopeptide (TPR) repeat protein
MIAELVANHQLTEIAPDRWVLHDLLRAYGRELCAPDEADAAFERLLHYLVHTGFAAAVQLAPSRVRTELPPRPEDVEVIAPTTREEAFAWFDSEQPNGLAVLRAAAGRADVLLWLYVWTIADYLDFRGRSGYQQAQDLALEAAIRLGDLPKQAHTRRDLARGHMAQREWDAAIRQHELALGIAEELGDEDAIAHGSLGLGRVYTRICEHRTAIEHTERALRIYERSGNVDARANALNNLGWYHSELGEYQTGLDYARQALKLYAEVDSEFGRAVAGDTAGYALAGLGRIDEAIELYEVAVDLMRKLGRRLDTADCLMAMARSQDRAGRGADAEASYAAALEILDALDHPDAETVRTCLAKRRS